mgnify:CR=1 FL=1
MKRINKIVFLIITLFSNIYASEPNLEPPEHFNFLTSDFRPRIDPHGSNNLDFHEGLDYRGGEGTPIKTIEDGRILKISDERTKIGARP